jgi:hypothetical protein
MQPVGRGDAHHVDPRIGQQFLVIAIDLPARFLGRRLHPRGVNVANGHRFATALGLQRHHDVHVGSTAAAGAYKSHADPLVGPLGALLSDGKRRPQHAGRCRRGGGRLEKLASRCLFVFVHGSVFSVSWWQLAGYFDEFIVQLLT